MKKKKFDKYKQGKYSPLNKEKYKGSLPIFYRSSWELKLFLWLDKHPSCVTWSSETTIVRYKFQGKMHRYYIDVTATFKTKTGTQKVMIEVKPYRQTIPPVPSKRKKRKTIIYENFEWAKNQSKWKYAREYARRRGAKFIILTEKDLFMGDK